jgi:hypothetical protein
LLVVNPELVCAALLGYTATFVTSINNYFFMALAYNNVYKNCTADEFVLNKKRVG